MNRLGIALAIVLMACGSVDLMPTMRIREKSSAGCRWRAESHGSQYAQLILQRGSSVDAVATIQIDELSDVESAKARILAISSETTDAIEWIHNGVPWPTMIRRYRAPVGGVNRQAMGRVDGEVPALTWVQLVGNRVVRVEARARDGGDLDDVVFFAHTITLANAPVSDTNFFADSAALEKEAKRIHPVAR